MTYKQRKTIEWIEHQIAALDSREYNEMADKMRKVLNFLYNEEYVWAVIIADASSLGPAFVEKIRTTFRVERIE